MPRTFRVAASRTPVTVVSAKRDEESKTIRSLLFTVRNLALVILPCVLIAACASGGSGGGGGAPPMQPQPPQQPAIYATGIAGTVATPVRASFGAPPTLATPGCP